METLTETLENSACLYDKAEVFITVLRANIEKSPHANSNGILECLAMIHKYLATLKKNHNTLAAHLTQSTTRH